MKRQTLYLLDYDWLCKVYYHAKPENAQEILDKMQEIGCSKDLIRQAKGNLLSGMKNNGVTYSNFKKHNSVLVIGETTSAAEFADSFDHEKGHLVKHICQAYDIDPYGEEAEYIAGNVAYQMFTVAKDYLCDCCRKKKLS